ncbi:pyridoxamine 5'-phosphate oxidase-domain-containing protein [Collybia nuda]|uniref:Pyridoxamine 5'-phosphate oxidase-domain-containing protein n=1 Tax=Collybia nuda TaxID=64659 RepID=A0A9P5YLA0_9AGAR|nr:pyridoxamine 5'-phosphate oxidase-domain-containing protein [Collybia nuda]
MATVFPSDDPKFAGQPFSLQEYYASCYKNGSLTLLFLPISRQNQNILHSPTHAASISITADVPSANRPRVSLLGSVTVFNDGYSIPNVDFIRRCYVAKHPDAEWWLPDDEGSAHIAYWARFDPHSVYFVGGFGGIHYIGDIPLPMYREAYRNDSDSRIFVNQHNP